MPLRFARTRLNIVPGLLAFLGLIALVVACQQMAGAEPPAKVDPATLELQRAALADRLDAIAKQAAQNQWLLTVVLAVGGLLTLAQGLFAFFTAQNYVKQADEAIGKIEKLAKEVRESYPAFARMEQSTKATFLRFTEWARQLELDQNLYERLEPVTRQEIASLENFVVIHSDPSNGGANLIFLGKFYADKYRAAGRSDEWDFERAVFYYEKAIKLSGGLDVSALNGLGWLYQEVAKTPNPAKAESLFEESIRIFPDQQRPMYNLGTMRVVAGDRQKLESARIWLERALAIANWERSPNPAFSCHVYYNAACMYSLLAELASNAAECDRLLDASVNQLQKAALWGGAARKTVENDLSLADLKLLAGSSAHEAKLKTAWKTFEEAWAKPRL